MQLHIKRNPYPGVIASLNVTDQGGRFQFCARVHAAGYIDAVSVFWAQDATRVEPFVVRAQALGALVTIADMLGIPAVHQSAAVGQAQRILKQLADAGHAPAQQAAA